MPKPGDVGGLGTVFPRQPIVVPQLALRQPDGKVVAVGLLQLNTGGGSSVQGRLVVARFGLDGSPDSSFGLGGRVTTLIGSGPVVAQAVALQADGKVLVGGIGGGRAVVVRLASNGALDRGFGAYGIAKGPGPGQSGVGTLAVRELADGEIVVVQAVGQASESDHRIPGGMVITRLRPDGSVGKRAVHSAPEWARQGTIAYGSWSEAAVLKDGSVVVAGNMSVPYRHACTDADPCVSAQEMLVRRFRPDGSVDSAFGSRGRAVTRIDGRDAFATHVAVAEDGTIVVAGVTQGAGSTAFAVARFAAGGALDKSFGQGGAVTLPGLGVDDLTGVALTADGGVVVGGGPPLTIVRLDRGGRPLKDFGRDGLVRVADAIRPEVLLSGADGGVDAVTFRSKDGPLPFFVLLRFTASGALGSDHAVPIGLPASGASAVATTSAGAVAIAGWAATDDNRIGIRVAVVGAAKPFGPDGEVTVVVGDQARATAVAIDGSGRVVAAGTTVTGASHQWVVVRLRPNGRPDPQFGAAGIAFPLSPSEDAEVSATAALPDGRLLVLGRTEGAYRLVRLNVDGTIDPSFGERGSLSLPLDRASALSVAGDGRAVVAGTMAKRLTAVVVDASGKLAPPLTQPLISDGVGIGLQRDGAVVAAGGSGDGLAVVRWRPGGSLDDSFGTNGFVLRAGYEPVGVAIQRDGRIDIAAQPRDRTGLAVLRFLHDGRSDPSFGKDGITTAAPAATPAATAILPDSIAVVGTASTPGGTDFALTTFWQGSLVAPLLEPYRRVDVFQISLRGTARRVRAVATQPAASPDGRQLAYIGEDAGAPEVFVSRADGSQPRQITHTPLPAGAVVARTAPTWSNDGTMLALQMLDDAGDPEIYVAASDGSDLYKVAAGTSPSWGDHHRLAYVANNDVFVSDLDHATTTRIGPGTASRWSPRGDLIATPTALIRTDGTRVASLNNFYDAHWAPDGNKLITISDGKLEAVNLRGAVTRTYATVGPDARSPVWSPDGRWIAYIGHASTYRLVILDARTGKRAALWALDGSFDFTTPSWTPTNVYVAHT